MFRGDYSLYSESDVITYQLNGFKRLYKATGYTFKEFSEHSGVNIRTIQDVVYENTKVTSGTAVKLACALECSVPDLVKPPSLKGALDDIVTELRLYRAFMVEVYEQYGEKLPEID